MEQGKVMSRTFRKNEERDFKKECLQMAGDDSRAYLSLSKSAKSFYEMVNQEIKGSSDSDYSGKSFGSNEGSSRRFKLS